MLTILNQGVMLHTHHSLDRIIIDGSHFHQKALVRDSVHVYTITLLHVIG